MVKPEISALESTRFAFLFAAWVFALGTMAQPRFPSALPADPLRPFAAETCEEAKARLEEARQGSPLVSAARNAEALRLAEEQVKRLCQPQGIQDGGLESNGSD